MWFSRLFPTRPRGFGEAAQARLTADDIPDRPDALPFPSTGPQGHRARMREKLLGRGAGALADYELLEMLLFFALGRATPSHWRKP